MPCNLKLSPTGDVNFLGTAGASVTLKLTAPDGVDAEIVHVRYGGNGISKPPFMFTINAGVTFLVVVVEATKAGAVLQLREDCGGSDQVLSTFHFDPQNPGRGFFIKSV
jgi:hypothetical protein